MGLWFIQGTFGFQCPTLSGMNATLDIAANTEELVSHQASPTDTGPPELPGGCLYPSGSPEKNEGVCQ
jgi:hypothetical protein